MKSLKINAVFNVIKSVMSIIFPLITFPYASRVLGVIGVGKVQYAQSIINYFSLFAALGISAYAVREGSKIKDDKKKLNQFSNEVFVLNLITTSVVYLVFFAFMLLHAFDGYILVLLITSLLMLFTTLSVEWIYQIKEEYSYISIRTVIFQFISLVCLFIFVKSKEDYLIYASLQVFAVSGFFFLNYYHSKQYISLLNIKCLTQLQLKKHIKPVLTIFGVSVASTIYTNLDMVMLGVMKGDYYVGLYSASVKITAILKQIGYAIIAVGVSRSSKLVEDEQNNDYNSLIRSMFHYVSVFIIPMSLGLLMLSKYGILLFTGEKYVASTLACQILAISAIISVFENLIYNLVILPNREENFACFASGLGACSNLVLNFILIPIIDINGAAIATLVSEVIVVCAFVIYLKRTNRQFDSFGDIKKILLASLPILIICNICISLFNSIIIVCVTSVCFSAFVYFLLLILLKVEVVLEFKNSLKKFLMNK